MMKKLTALLLTSALALLLLSGCGNNGSDSDGKVKIEFFQYKSEARDTFNKLIAKFEKENPNIDVELVSPPEAETVLKTRVAKNDVPDIVAIGANSTFADLSKAGVFAEVTNDPALNNVQPAYVDMIHHVTESKKLYALPYAANADGVIYNKTLFKELGLTEPKTWKEFISVCEKIKATGKIPFYFTLKDAWTALPAFNALAANTQEDKFFENRKVGKTTFEKGYKEASQKFVKLLSYGHKDMFGKGYADGNVAFAKGESVMYLQGIWAIPEIKKANPKIELGVFPYPVTNDSSKNKLVSGVDLLLSISKRTEHPKEARKFVDFLLNPQNAKTYISEQNAFSAVKGVTQEDPNVEGLKPSFEKGMLVDFPDHSIPIAVQLEKLLQGLSHKKDVNGFLKSLDTGWNKVQNR
jgi:raffinose/stachyose/melibiose transport system substrate-binding protein